MAAISAYQDYSKRRVLAATPVQAPAPKAVAGMFEDLPLAATPVQAPAPDGIQFGANDKIVPTVPTEPQSAIDRFLADAPASSSQTATDRNKGTITPPFTYEEASASKTQSTAEQEHYRSIYAAHPDVDTILASPAFQAWSTKYPAYKRVVAKGTAQEVIEMFTAYKNRR